MQNNPIPLKVGDRVAIAATARKVSPQEMDKLINKKILILCHKNTSLVNIFHLISGRVFVPFCHLFC